MASMSESSRLRLLATAGTAAGLLDVPSGSASAVGANCQAERIKIAIRFLPGYFYAQARCSSINTDTKVRAKLDRTADSHAHSEWFTTTNKWYSTGERTCGFGCSATYDVAQR